MSMLTRTKRQKRSPTAVVQVASLVQQSTRAIASYGLRAFLPSPESCSRRRPCLVLAEVRDRWYRIPRAVAEEIARHLSPLEWLFLEFTLPNSWISDEERLWFWLVRVSATAGAKANESAAVAAVDWMREQCCMLQAEHFQGSSHASRKLPLRNTAFSALSVRQLFPADPKRHQNLAWILVHSAVRISEFCRFVAEYQPPVTEVLTASPDKAPNNLVLDNNNPEHYQDSRVVLLDHHVYLSFAAVQTLSQNLPPSLLSFSYSRDTYADEGIDTETFQQQVDTPIHLMNMLAHYPSLLHVRLLHQFLSPETRATRNALQQLLCKPGLRTFVISFPGLSCAGASMLLDHAVYGLVDQAAVSTAPPSDLETFAVTDSRFWNHTSNSLLHLVSNMHHFPRLRNLHLLSHASLWPGFAVSVILHLLPSLQMRDSELPLLFACTMASLDSVVHVFVELRLALTGRPFSMDMDVDSRCARIFVWPQEVNQPRLLLQLFFLPPPLPTEMVGFDER